MPNASLPRTWLNQFPDYDGVLPVIDGLKDSSWRNDVCPSLENDDGSIRVWCDYVDPTKREMKGLFRFVVVRDGEELFCTDSIALVRILIRHLLSDNVGSETGE